MKRSDDEEEYEYDEYDEDYEEDDYEEYDDDDYEDDAPGKSRTVIVLTALAILCGLLLLGVLGMSFIAPLLSGQTPELEADPGLMLHEQHAGEEAILKDNPILETSEPEATTEPTIPPEPNPFDQYDFQYNRNNYLYCLKQESFTGVDVSAFQHDVDWNQVKASGVQFAMLRLGYRGWGSKGTLVEDEYIRQNLAGTAAAGLPIGVYFFSQATTLDEVLEEIEFMLSILGDYRLDYPIVLDWEVPEAAEARTRSVDRRTLTNMLRFFCDEMSGRGFDPMIYFNWTQSSRMLYLNELEDYPFWLALYQDRMTYPFRIDMWQYTSTGHVPGIEGEVDLNLYIPDLRKR